MQEVPNNLKLLREAAGWSVHDLVERTGKVESLILRMEGNANVTISTALTMCAALGCTLNDLYDVKGAP